MPDDPMPDAPMPNDPGPGAWQQLPPRGGPGAPALDARPDAGLDARPRPRPPTPLSPRPRSWPSATVAPGAGLLTMAAAVALVGAGTGTSLALSAGSAGGAASPAAAVSDLVTALGNSDVIGMLDALAPGERDAIEPGLEGIFGQFKRLGILSADADLGDVTGVSAKYGGFTTSTDPLAPGVAAVTVTGGSVTGSVDPGQLPLATYFKDLLGVALNGTVHTATSPASGPLVLGTEEVGGSWYVSLGYSIAINVLKGEGQSGAPPAASSALAAVGASTPEGAVQALFGAVSNLDLGGLLADFPPDEMAALDAYAPDWLPQAQSALDKAKTKVSIEFSNLSFTTQALSDGTLVRLGPGLAFQLSAQGANVSYANGCVTEQSQGRLTHECRSQEMASLDKFIAMLPASLQAVVERLVSSKPDEGFVTVQEDGSWFVSPLRTAFQSVSAWLALFQPSDIQTFISAVPALKADIQKYFEQLAPELGERVPSLAALGQQLG